MSATAWGLFALFLIVLLLAAWPLSIWLTRICAGDVPSWVKNIETPLWRLGGVSVEHSMKWSQYAVALLSFNILGVAAVMKSALPLFFYAAHSFNGGCLSVTRHRVSKKYFPIPI